MSFDICHHDSSLSAELESRLEAHRDPIRLYCIAGDASQAAHLLLREAGLSVELVGVDPHAQVTDEGIDYRGINPRGEVPALELAQGEVTTGVIETLQHIAELAPSAELLPVGAFERYQALSWLDFIAHDLHGTITKLFNQEIAAGRSKDARLLRRRLSDVDAHLRDRPFLMGNRFTAPDAYLYVVAKWLPFLGIDLGRWPALDAFKRRVQVRPAVVATLVAEGFKPES